LKTAGGVTYTYDGDGRRVQKSNGKLYWYGGGSSALDETDASGSTANATFSEYIYFDGERIARRDYQNNVFYYFTDQINSSRVIAEIPSGGSTYTLCYDGDFYPFGGEDVFTNTCPQNYKWTGKERDAETGTDDFDARYYSPVYGRFLSADWSAVPVAVPYANLTNPQTLNLYAIVRDNPESFADLDGHAAVLGPEVCGADGCGTNQNASANIPAKNAAQNQNQNQSSSQSNAVVIGAAAGAVGGAVVGAVVGAVSGAAVGTAVEPGGGTIVVGIVGAGQGAQAGAETGAAIGAAAGALAPVVYAKTKDAVQKVGSQIERALDHVGKLNGPDQNPNPRGGWKQTIRDAANQIDKQAGRISNQNLSNAARFTAQLLRGLVD
jgi:RHS repeat-associated protein